MLWGWLAAGKSDALLKLMSKVYHKEKTEATPQGISQKGEA